MDIHQLECFIAVAQYLSFTEAAKHLYIAQSAVSHAISELEKELNLKLFIRNRGMITLNRPGEILFKDAIKITSQFNQIYIKMQAMAEGAVGELSVGFVFEPIVESMTACFRRFHQKYPDINVTYNSYHSINLSRFLENKQLDVGFARPVTLNKFSALNWKKLYRDPIYVGLSVGHRLAGETQVDLDALADETIIVMSRNANPGMFDHVNHMFMCKGITPRIVDTTNDLMTQVMMARIGLGVVFLPDQFTRMASKDITFIPLNDENAYHDIGIVWHKENNNPAIPLLIKEIELELFSKMAGQSGAP